MTDKQAEALELAELFESWAKIRGESESGSSTRAARELRRLHARVVELEEGRRAIIAEKDDYKLALRHARAELEAIGSCGVESLRGAKPLTEEQVWEINAKSNVPHRRPEHVTDCWGDEKTIWHETTTFSFLLFARNIERAHGIGS